MADILKELCSLSGVSGNEDDVRNYIINSLRGKADDISVDNLGNVIAYKSGRSGKRTAAIFAHMDEVGLIVSKIRDDGFVKFKSVGDVEERSIVSKCVKINKKVDGVLGMKAIHLQKRDERDTAADIRDLYIDIGAKSKKQAMKNVSYGDYIAFESQYFTAGNKISAKALESRAGCKVLLDIAKEEFDCNLYMIFTAQREIGMRGASVALYGRKADAALILDGFESADMYGMSDEEAYAELGGGAVLEFMDRYAIPDRDMTARYERLLCESGVKLQKKKSALGLTDAGAVQRSECGVLTACIGIPVRYTHTPQCMADRRDIKALGSAAEVFIKGLEEIIR